MSIRALSRLAARRCIFATAAASSTGISFPAANSSAAAFFVASPRPAAEKGARPLHTYTFTNLLHSPTPRYIPALIALVTFASCSANVYLRDKRASEEAPEEAYPDDRMEKIRESPFPPNLRSKISSAIVLMFLIWNQRDLGAGDSAFGALVAASLAAGGVGILILKKHPDDAGSNVTNEDTKEASRKPEVTDNKPMQVEVTDMEKRDVVVEARFREWMKREGKVYPNQEEERKRFEVFKKTLEKMDALYKKSSVRPTEGPWADMTYEEIKETRGFNKRVNHDQRREEEKAMTRMLKERAQKMMEEGKLKSHNHPLLFPEKQKREQKIKEEGSLHNCSKL